MKKPTNNIILLAITGLFFIIACESDRCFHGTGQITSRRFETEYFCKMGVQGLFNIVLIEDSLCYVEFEGGEKVLDYVDANNIDSVLWLDNYNHCFFLRKYDRIKAYVHFQKLDRLDLFEVCKVESYDSLTAFQYMTVQGEMAEMNIILNCERFSFYNHRTTGGDFSFSGNVDRCWISGYYTAKFTMDELVVRDFFVRNSSLSDMYVNATERLRVEILHHGNIYYSGTPEIIVDSIAGTGQLLPWIEAQ